MMINYVYLSDFQPTDILLKQKYPPASVTRGEIYWRILL